MPNREEFKDLFRITGLPRDYKPALKKIYPFKEAYDAMVNVVEYLSYCGYDGIWLRYEKHSWVSIDISYFLNTPEGHLFDQVVTWAREGEVAEINEVNDWLLETYANFGVEPPFAGVEVRLV